MSESQEVAECPRYCIARGSREPPLALSAMVCTLATCKVCVVVHDFHFYWARVVLYVWWRVWG